MTKLTNGVCTYKTRWVHDKLLFQVYARFHGNIEVVFESHDLKECRRYAHKHEMRIMEDFKRTCIVCASFRKVNAKKPFRAEDYEFGTVD